MRSIGLYIFIGTFLLSTIFASVRPVSYPYIGLALFFVVTLYAVHIRTGVQGNLYLLLIFISSLLAIGRQSLIPTSIPKSFEKLIDAPISLEGTVIALPDIRETAQKLTLKVTQGEEQTRIIASAPLYPPMRVGDSVIVAGKLTQPKPFETDGGRTFDYKNFLRKDGVYALVQPASISRIGEDHSPWLFFLWQLQKVKDLFMGLVTVILPEPESALADGIIVGGKQGLGATLLDAFTKAGMLQIVVLSGYNVMIVSNLIVSLGSRMPKRMVGIIAGSSIACFVLASGAGSSAMRAGVMAFFAIAAQMSGKRYDVLRVLCITIFLLTLWNPLLLVYDPGFQFSCIATIGLILGVPLIAPKLLFLRSPLLIELVSTTLAAELFLLPLLLWETGNLSLISVLANVLAMPVLPFAMAASALGAVVAFPLSYLSPTFAIVAGVPAYLPLWYVIHIATISASLPFANMILPTFPFWIVVVSYVLIGAYMVRAYVTVPTPQESAPLHL